MTQPADPTAEERVELRDRHRSLTPRDFRKLVAGVVFLVAAVCIGIASDLVPPTATYAVGSIAPTTGIKAPIDKQVENQVETKQAQDAARAAVEEVFDYTQEQGLSTADEQVTLLTTELAPVDNAMQSTVAPEARKIALDAAVANLPSTARPLLLALPPARWPDVRSAAVTVLKSAETPELRDVDLRGRKNSLASQYMPPGLSIEEQQLVVALVTPLLVPNSFPSDALTQQKRDAAAAAVPPVIDQIKAGEIIVDAGHQITEADMVKIHALGLDKQVFDWGRVAAWVLVNALVAALMLLWLWRFRPAYWHRERTLLLIGLIFVLAVLAMKLPAGRSTLPFFVPATAASILLAVLLDSTTGLVMAAVVSVVAGTAAVNYPLELAMYVLLGSFAGVLAIQKGDRLHHFVEAGIAIAVTDVVVVGVFTLLGQQDLTGFLQLSGAAVASSVLAGVVSLGSFAALGNLFGILTGWQLLELANPSQPLLRRLLMETPGTYHHALMVGNLAERAAAAIGADSLLVRVAAYYHDIGKLGNPLAFIENQAGAENVHDTLDPEDSAAVLKQHVPDGIELAYRTKLPKPLIAFIPQHHGTALLSYFYAKARDRAAEPFGGIETAAGKAAADAIDQRRFRHAGPKPQSKEAAILMLSDGVEASVRSLSSRDEPSIRAMVSKIIDERLKDGQLDECDLTIRDLERVREAFIEQLLGMYHQRIEYPQNKIVELESRRERGLA